MTIKVISRKSGERKFGGKIYQLWGFSITKKESLDYAKRLREHGHLARVVKVENPDGWAVYGVK